MAPRVPNVVRIKTQTMVVIATNFGLGDEDLSVKIAAVRFLQGTSSSEYLLHLVVQINIQLNSHDHRLYEKSV